jgi:hypothetical protein
MTAAVEDLAASYPAPVFTGRCEVNECGRRCKDRLMCTSHWRLVEPECKDALREAIRDVRARRTFDLDAVDAAARRCIHTAEIHERG